VNKNQGPTPPWHIVDIKGRKFVRVLRTEAYFEYRTCRNSAGEIIGQIPVEKHRVIEEFQEVASSEPQEDDIERHDREQKARLKVLRGKQKTGTITKAEVRELQTEHAMYGCCNRFGDYQACDCMENAIGCRECGDTGWKLSTGNPQNGWNRNAKRCSKGCPSQCNICGNPDCDNPNGQH
jgi:hypothetical protein